MADFRTRLARLRARADRREREAADQAAALGDAGERIARMLARLHDRPGPGPPPEPVDPRECTRELARLKAYLREEVKRHGL